MCHLTTTMTARLQRVAAAVIFLLLAATAHAAAPGISGGTGAAAAFDITAEAAYINEPDGATVYSWGYGCHSGPAGFLPTAISGANCPTMQIPGPTMIVTEGQVVTVTLHDNLPAAAGNASILFPGFNVTATGGTPGLLAQEACNENASATPCTTKAVTYTFVADKPGTHAYYSGTQGDLQVEMGMYGALIVLPKAIPAECSRGLYAANLAVEHNWGESDFRLPNASGGVGAAYDNAKTCYDREYLFQFSEMDPAIHRQAEEQAGQACANPTGCMNIATEPYHPAYFMMNGRSFPDNLDPNYAVQYPHQPYNGNPHMHPGEVTLVREIGTGRWQHPFHEHANHLRVLARDGNMLLTPTGNLAGPLLFTTTSTPGQAMDSLFYWTGKGLNWDVYGHTPEYASATAPCVPDANGYYTGFSPRDTGYLGSPNPTALAAPNYYEWCQDHNKPLEEKPFGQVGNGGPATLPDPNILTNGAWYGGSPYLGPDATQRAVGSTPIPPSGTVANSPSEEAGFAFMWHSHNERELTTNNIFPGGMMTLMLVDPRVFQIDESK